VARYVTAPWEEVAAPDRFLMWRAVAKVMLGPAGLPGASDLFFENQGDGTFKEATEKSGLVDTTKAYGFGVVATDYDGDGWTDIFVSNDSNPNFLYHNRRGHGFESVGLMAGVALNAGGRAQAGMGADSGDFDGDGWLDLTVATFAFDHDSLHRNLGDGSFEDVSQAAGTTAAPFMSIGRGPEARELGAADPPELRRGREQPRARSRRPRSGRRRGPPPAGVPREEPGVREHVHRAGEDLPGRGSQTRRAGDHRTPPAAEPHSFPGSRAQAAVPMKPSACSGADIIRLSRPLRRACE
jgi:hypothetical protein